MTGTSSTKAKKDVKANSTKSSLDYYESRFYSEDQLAARRSRRCDELRVLNSELATAKRSVYQCDFNKGSSSSGVVNPIAFFRADLSRTKDNKAAAAFKAEIKKELDGLTKVEINKASSSELAF